MAETRSTGFLKKVPLFTGEIQTENETKHCFLYHSQPHGAEITEGQETQVTLALSFHLCYFRTAGCAASSV